MPAKQFLLKNLNSVDQNMQHLSEKKKQSVIKEVNIKHILKTQLRFKSRICWPVHNGGEKRVAQTSPRQHCGKTAAIQQGLRARNRPQRFHTSSVDFLPGPAAQLLLKGQGTQGTTHEPFLKKIPINKHI